MLNMESKFADISDELWDRVQWLLPTPPVRRNHKGGRPPTPDRVVLSGNVNLPDDDMGRQHQEGWDYVVGAVADRFVARAR